MPCFIVKSLLNRQSLLREGYFATANVFFNFKQFKSSRNRQRSLQRNMVRCSECTSLLLAASETGKFDSDFIRYREIWFAAANRAFATTRYLSLQRMHCFWIFV